jgi:intracellular sulfur oxidation DsrE/DsrF family protein
MSEQAAIVVHVSSQDSRDWAMAVRNLVNLVNDDSIATPPESMEVVVNGHAVRYLLATAPESDRVTQMATAGVDIVACGNSLERFGYAPEALADGVGTVPAGVAEVVRAQQRGSTYLKLP